MNARSALRVRTLALLAVAASAVAAGCGGGGGSSATTSKVVVRYPAPANANEILAIVVNDSSGGVVSSTEVTSSGSQEVVIPNAGSVMLAAAIGTTSFAYSSVVEPPAGTTLTFAEPFPTPVPAPTSVETWNVTLTSPPSGATRYVVYGPCGSHSSSSIATLFSVTNQGCLEKTKVLVLAVAYDGNGSAIAWKMSPEQTVANGTTASLTLDLDQKDVVQVLDTFQNVPASAIYATAQLEMDDPHFGGPPSWFSGNPVPNGSTLASTFMTVPNVGPVFSYETLYSNFGQIFRIRHLDATPGSIAFDLSGLEMPIAPSFDAPTATWEWGMPAFGDGQIFETFMNDAQDPTVRIHVTALMPSGIRSYALPQVPPEFRPVDPVSNFASSGYVVAPDFPELTSYGDFVEVYGLPTFSFYGDAPRPMVALIASVPI